MTFAKATKVADKILGGWADAYRVAKCSLYGIQEGPVILVNSHGQVLDFWGGMSWWWVETNELSVERDTAKSLENLFGNSNSLSCVDSDSIMVDLGAGLGTITLGASLRHKITAPRATGKWDYERVTLETTNPPHPIRRALISLLTGAKWTPYSSKHETKYYGYLRLMPNPAYLTQKTPSNN